MQSPKPSPFIASVLPGKVFDPQRHVAFGSVFLEHSMSPLADEIRAITAGAGLPDRADQGWITLEGAGAAEAAYRFIDGAPGYLAPGTGRCGIQADAVALPGIHMDLYADQREICLGLCRTAVSIALPRFQSRPEFSGIAVRDETDSLARIGVMGPDSRKLLRSLGVLDAQLRNVGDHVKIEIIQEPVRVCRSDFAGANGFDLIIPKEPFNSILAVICSWGVRLGLNLLPVGWDATQQIARVNAGAVGKPLQKGEAENRTSFGNA